MVSNIDFTEYAFKSTGGTANRTMPDRLAERKNVLDYGADPTNNVDCTANIQAAVNAAIAAGSGVYFPSGYYKVSNSGTGSAILIPGDADFSFYMEGSGGVTIDGSSNCPGYIIDRSLATPHNTTGPRRFEGLGLINTTAGGGCLRIGSTIGVIARNCNFGAFGTGMTTEDAPGASSQGILVDTCNFGGHDLSSVGLVMGGTGAMTSCEFNGIGRGAIVYGKGISLNANRCERCSTAFQLGVDAGGVDRGLHGFSFVCEEMEGVTTFIDIMGTMTGFTIGPVGCLGHPIGNSGLAGYEENTKYGIRIRPNTAYYGVFTGCGSDQFFDIGAVYIEDYTTTKRSFITFSHCNPKVGGGSGTPWRIPAASVWPYFENSTISSASNAPGGSRYTYAGLPTGADVQEGDEFDISDSTTTTIGSTVTTGGGSSRIHVRWNSTSWICLPG